MTMPTKQSKHNRTGEVAIKDLILSTLLNRPYLTTSQKRLEEIMYDPCIDRFVELSQIRPSVETGGYFVGEIEGKRAYPSQFLEVKNISKGAEIYIQYLPEIKFNRVNGAIGDGHTHPTLTSVFLRSDYISPSVDDKRSLEWFDIPFGMIVSVTNDNANPIPPAYLKAFGLEKSEKSKEFVSKELGIVYNGERYAGILYLCGNKHFVRSDAEAYDIFNTRRIEVRTKFEEFLRKNYAIPNKPKLISI